MPSKKELVRGVIKHIGCARIDGNDHFAVVLEDKPYTIYTGNRNPRLAIAREGQYVELLVEPNSVDPSVIFIHGFTLLPSPA